jgi:Beta-lactamase class C and other penicillin binding proteins
MNLETQMDKIIKGYDNIGGIIVQKDGQTVYENYFNECTVTTGLHIFSVTKSIISILIGIAIDKGYINSIHQKILDFYPDYIVKEGEKTIQKITLKDMLTMTTPYKFEQEPYMEYFTSDNWVNSALDLLGGNGTIGEFRYTPLIGPDIFSGILVKATGQSVLDFATESLFSPLGISVDGNVVFQKEEEQLAWYHKKDYSGWVADPQGINTAGWGLALTPVDMAKIGQLYLDGGKWMGKQIVSTSWIEESTKEHSRWGQLAYGYLWWIIDNKEQIYAALGDGGNVIYVNTRKNMVVSIASFFDPSAKDRLELIREYIEPMFCL